MDWRRLVAVACCVVPAAAQGGGRPTDVVPLGVAVRQDVAAAFARGIDWLLRHQDEDGRWSASLFVRHDPKDAPCTGVGKPDKDLLVTSFALCALLEDGSAQGADRLRSARQLATRWLTAQADGTGFLGAAEAGNAVVEHAIATYALSRAAVGGDPAVVRAAQMARQRLLMLRIAGSGWPHSVGDPALSGEATLWAGFALLTQPGTAMSREARQLPSLLALDPTLPPAASCAAQLFVGLSPGAAECAVITDHPPRWPDREHPADFLGWYLGSMACERLGGAHWNGWRDALLAASLPHQRRDGSHDGSWDPVDRRGKDGGRVFATAMNLHCLLIVLRGK